MPGHLSSHGAAIHFAGNLIGYLTDYDIEENAGPAFETTNVTSTVVGTGENARVIKTYDWTSVEPVTISIKFWGAPPYSQYQSGTKGEVDFQLGDVWIHGPAVLESWTFTGRANTYASGTVRFRLTGATS